MLSGYISKLGNSRPIFKLHVDFKKERVDSKLINEYCPVADENDPISVLVCSHFRENLQDDKFVKDYDSIKKSVVQEIKLNLKRFIDCHGGFKNAKQSAIFRFMNSYNTPEPLIDGLVYLYKYCKSLGMATNGTFTAGTTGVEQKHIDNILAIIELMRSKFEPKS